MSAKNTIQDLEFNAKTMSTCVKSTFESMGHLEFSQDPELVEKEILEYNGRMRANGMSKFNNPCYVGVVNFFFSQKDFDHQKAAGALILYVEQEIAKKLLKALGNRLTDDDNEDELFDAATKFCNSIAEAFKQKIIIAGYHDLILSTTEKYKNEAPDGVNFCYDERKYFEISFEVNNNKAIVTDFTFAPIPS